ncbi:septal ring lytic transglycosylase RlpA family protein [Parazoarcus communis]|nr:septal ring lytic transglycosylase RlpA family protein [Parazoarcus communis]
MNVLPASTAVPETRALLRTALLCVSMPLLMTACGTAPKPVPGQGSGTAQAPDQTTRAPVAAPAQPARPARRGGAYYKDDGPDEVPPDNLHAIPDAEPRAEPLHRFANRPYSVFGQDYVPVTQLQPHRERGLGSWYGRRFHGNPTSSGEPYDMYGMTAAHPTLPIPSYARVTHVESGRSVVVRINDRGPFHKGRIIDLSYTAAYKLGYVNAGSAEVIVEQILPDEVPMVAATTPVPPLPGRRPLQPVIDAAPVAQAPSAPVTPLAEASRGVFLQLGAFSSLDNAIGFRTTVEAQVAAFADRLELFADGGRFRLHAGPYVSVEEARQAAERIATVLKARPFVVVR